MSKENTLLKTPRVSIIPRNEISKDNFGKYLELDVPVTPEIETTRLTLDSLIKQIKVLQEIVGTLAPVNWLRGWGAFRFDDMTPDEIATAQNNITIRVRGLLSAQDAAEGTFHTITFKWVEHTPIIFTLEAYLNPPAEIVQGPGGGTTGTVTPNQPGQPQPPF